MSNGAAAPIDEDVPDGCEVGGPAVVAVPKGATDDEDEDAVAEGMVNEMPRRAAIGCHGLRAERFSSLPVILAFRRDLKIDSIKNNMYSIHSLHNVTKTLFNIPG